MSRGRAAPRELLVLAAAVLALSLCRHAAASASEAPDYGDALSKSLLYFEAQRSGRLPYGQRVRWRGHSGLTDGLQQGVDLVGGYYDAGDHVKFGLPMAFTVTMLAWGAIEFGDDIADAGEWRHALEAIKWGTDYFVKAHTERFVYWAEVRTYAHVTQTQYAQTFFYRSRERATISRRHGKARDRSKTSAINLLTAANDGEWMDV
jgi:hypothetical protein